VKPGQRADDAGVVLGFQRNLAGKFGRRAARGHVVGGIELAADIGQCQRLVQLGIEPLQHRSWGLSWRVNAKQR
jgi:hypothetical protein